MRGAFTMANHRTWILLVALGIAVAACGGDDADPPGDAGLDAAGMDGGAPGDGGGLDGSVLDGAPGPDASTDGDVPSCDPGFEPSGVDCVDIDECTRDLDDCGALVACTNTPGSFTCGECLDGYVDVMGVCEDLDECLGEGAGAPCARIACTNTPGGFTCGTCPTGWDDPAGDSSVCVDFDECQGEGGGDDCHSNARCTNTLGGFTCACRSGFSGDGRTCTAAGSPGGLPGGPILGVDNYVRSIDGGDLNEDGELDIVVITASTSGNDMDVFLSDGSGGYVATVTYPVFAQPWAVLIADLDEDTHLDVLATNYNGDSLLHFSGDGSGALTAQASHPGDNTRDIVVEDFDRDGNLDVAYASWGDDSIRLSWGDGTGAFPSMTSFAGGDGPSGLCSGDFNGDGHIDLAVTNGTTSTRRVALMLGDGSRGFGAPTSPITTPATPGHAACADFDVDGDLDVAVATRDDVRVFFGTGAGALTGAVTLSAGTTPNDVEPVDLDNDGRVDLVSSSRDGWVHTFLSNGTRVLPSPLDTWTGTVVDIATVDYDGNAAPDLAVGLTSGSVNLDPLGILIGEGTGGFSAPTRMPGGGYIRLDDVDGDGDLDMVATSGDEVLTFLGDGSGTLTETTRTSLAAGAAPLTAAVADVDEDGRQDLIVPNGGTDNVTVLLGDGVGGFRVDRTWPALADTEDVDVGDFDEDGHIDYAVVTSPSSLSSSVVLVHFGDGTGDFTRMASFMAEHTAEDVRTADMNDDRHLDLVVGHDNITGRLTILHGDGLGGFTPGPTLRVTRGVDELALLDFDEDGVMDIVTVSGTLPDSFITVFLGDGAGAYPSPGEYVTLPLTSALAIGDFDEDGHLDVAAGSHSARGLCVHPGTATGTLGAPTCHGLAYVAHMVAADLDEDAHTDIVTSDSVDLSVYFN